MKMQSSQTIRTTADWLLNLVFDYYSIYKPPNSKSVFVNDSTKEWVYIGKDSVCAILRNLFYTVEKRTITKITINTVYEMIDALGSECKDEILIIDSLYQDKEKIIYDIQGSDKYVEINKEEIKILQKKDSVYLFNSINRKNYVLPNTNTKVDYFEIIGKLFNVSEKESVLLGVYIACLFVKSVQHPLLILSGDYGASKTTTQRKIASIISPFDIDVISLPNNTDDIATILNKNYYVAFDNVASISREISDLFCIAVTGGSYQKRKLYTNDTINSIKLSNPISVTGLDLQLEYTDLLDRSIVLSLERISDNQRKTEEKVWQEFYKLLPDLQGCICQLLRKALNMYDNVILNNSPRLADFAKWGYTIAESYKIGYGNIFLSQYNDNIIFTNKYAINSSPLLNTIEYLMEDLMFWEGSSSELLFLLKNAYMEMNSTETLPKGLPTTANSLSRKLNSSKNDLKNMGIHLEIGRNTNRYIKLTHQFVGDEVKDVNKFIKTKGGYLDEKII